jgi:hypothetical protein
VQRRHAQVTRSERFGGFGAGKLGDQTVGVAHRLTRLIRLLCGSGERGAVKAGEVLNA